MSSAEHTTAPTRDAWLAERRTGIGSSDAPVVLGLSKWKSPLRLYYEKLGEATDSPEESEAAEWGRTLEPILAQRYTRDTGRPVIYNARQHIMRGYGVPWLLATVDALVPATRDVSPWPTGSEYYVPPASTKPAVPLPFAEDGILEIKTTSFFNREEWADEPPLYYMVQVQHQLAALNLKWASMAVLIGGQRFLWMDVLRDDAFIEALLEKEAEFWERVRYRNPPPVDGSDDTKALLKELYARPTASDAVPLPPEALDWHLELAAAKADRKAAEAREQAVENQIKAAIGEHEAGVLPSGVVYTLKLQHRDGYTVRPTDFRVLRVKGAPR